MVLLIHGPLCEAFLKHTLQDLKKNDFQYVSRLIISTYVESQKPTEEIVAKYCEGLLEKCTTIYSQDVFNPGFYNLNRQINLVNAGLRICDNTDMVIKLRMDQRVNIHKVSHFILKNQEKLQQGALLTTNCYTRRDRFYHPSDMFLAGTSATLKKYYPAQLEPRTHLDSLLAVTHDYQNGVRDFSDHWPESYLFKNFLRNVGWDIKNSHEDSVLSLKKNCVIVNSWNIDLKWIKFLKGKFPVLPYRFKIAPFENGPIEDASCYLAAELGGKRGLLDQLYLGLGRLYYQGQLYSITAGAKAWTRRNGAQLYHNVRRYIPPVAHSFLEKFARAIYQRVSK